MSSAAALLQTVSTPSATAQGGAAPAQDAGAATLFTDLVAQLMAPETAAAAQPADPIAPNGAPAKAMVMPAAQWLAVSSAVAQDTTDTPVAAAVTPPPDNPALPETAETALEAEPAPVLQLLAPQPLAPEVTAGIETPAEDEAALVDAQVVALLVQTLAPAVIAPKPEPVRTKPETDHPAAKPVSSDMAAPVIPSAAKPTDAAEGVPAARTTDIEAVKSELAALKLDTPEAVKPIPVETARQIFSLAQVVTDTTATPYTPPPAIAAQTSALSHTAVEQLSQLSIAIQKRLNDGTTKFQLELKPADLGRVDVALTITGEGKVSAHLEFDSPITATTFAARESELRQHLTAAGLKLDGEALTFSSRTADTPATQNSAFTGFGDPQTGQQARPNARQANRALKQADQNAAEADLDAALAQLRHRRGSGRLALDLTV